MEFFYETVKDEVSLADFGTRLPQKLKNLSEYMHFLQEDKSNYGHKNYKNTCRKFWFLNVKSSSLFRCAPSSSIMTCFAGWIHSEVAIQSTFVLSKSCSRMSFNDAPRLLAMLINLWALVISLTSETCIDFFRETFIVASEWNEGSLTFVIVSDNFLTFLWISLFEIQGKLIYHFPWRTIALLRILEWQVGQWWNDEACCQFASSHKDFL